MISRFIFLTFFILNYVKSQDKTSNSAINEALGIEGNSNNVNWISLLGLEADAFTTGTTSSSTSTSTSPSSPLTDPSTMASSSSTSSSSTTSSPYNPQSNRESLHHSVIASNPHISSSQAPSSSTVSEASSPSTPDTSPASSSPSSFSPSPSNPSSSPMGSPSTPSGDLSSPSFSSPSPPSSPSPASSPSSPSVPTTSMSMPSYTPPPGSCSVIQNTTNVTISSNDNVSVKIQANLSLYQSSQPTGVKLAIDKNSKAKMIKMIDKILNQLLASIPAATPIGNKLEFNFNFAMELAVNSGPVNTTGFIVNYCQNSSSSSPPGGSPNLPGNGSPINPSPNGNPPPGTNVITITTNVNSNLNNPSPTNNNNSAPSGNVTNGSNITINVGGVNVTVNLNGQHPIQIKQNNPLLPTAGSSLNVSGFLNGLVPTINVNIGINGGQSDQNNGNNPSNPNDNGNSPSNPNNGNTQNFNISVNFNGLLPMPNNLGIVTLPLSKFPTYGSSGNLNVSITLTLPGTPSGNGGNNNGNTSNDVSNTTPINGSTGTTQSTPTSSGMTESTPTTSSGSSPNANGNGGNGNGGDSINITLTGSISITSFNGVSPSNGFVILPLMALINNGMFPNMNNLISPGVNPANGPGMNISLTGIVPISHVNGNPVSNSGGNPSNNNNGGTSPLNIFANLYPNLPGFGNPNENQPSQNPGIGGLNITITITLPPNTNVAGGPAAPPTGTSGSMPNSSINGGNGGGPRMQITITVNGVLPPMSNLTSSYGPNGYNINYNINGNGQPPNGQTNVNVNGGRGANPPNGQFNINLNGNAVNPPPQAANGNVQVNVNMNGQQATVPSTSSTFSSTSPSPTFASSSSSSSTSSSTAPSTTTITTKAPCPVEGTWSAWGPLQGVCTKNCGKCGQQTQSRTCISAAQGCPCTGSPTQTVDCNPQPCTFPDNSCCSGKPAKSTSKGGAIVCS